MKKRDKKIKNIILILSIILVIFITISIIFLNQFIYKEEYIEEKPMPQIIEETYPFAEGERTWFIEESTQGFKEEKFGWHEAKPVQGDYDGDGKTDLAVFHQKTGTWYLMQSKEGFKEEEFGWSETDPYPADYDGDGKADLAVWYPASGKWYIAQSKDGFKEQAFGWSAVKPVPADYDGDGKADLAVYHKEKGDWYILQSRDGFKMKNFGWEETDPYPADYDGDGKADLAVFHPASGKYFILQSKDGFKEKSVIWTYPIPVPGDYDGDNKDDIAIFGKQDPRSNADSRFGFVGDLVAAGGDMDDYWKPFEDIGFKWDRGPHGSYKLDSGWAFGWHQIEDVEGTYDFTETDEYVREQQIRGIHGLPTLWPYVEWDQARRKAELGNKWQTSGGHGGTIPESRYMPHNMNAYRNYVKAVVERYDGDRVDDMPDLRYPIKYWEVMNEPETSLLKDAIVQDNPHEVYYKILKASYESVKEVCADCQVHQGGVGELNIFWTKVLDMGGANYFDIWSIHSIPPYLNTDDFYIKNSKEIIAKYAPEKDVWIAETNMPAGVSISTMGKTIKLSETDQAKTLITAHVKGFAAGAKKIFYTAYKAEQTTSDTEVEKIAGLGASALITNTGRKRPAYYAMKTMINKLDFFTNIEKLQVSNAEAYKFEFKDKNPVYVYWSDSPNAIINLGIGDHKITDMHGNEFSKSYGDDLILNPNNVFFVESTELEQIEPEICIAGWTEISQAPEDMPSGKQYGEINGIIYVTGGGISKTYAYDTNTNTWSTKANAPTKREAGCGAAAMDANGNKKLYVMGGYSGNQDRFWGEVFNSVEAYNPRTNTWQTDLASMPVATRVAGCTVYENKIYVIGGWKGAPYNFAKTQVYDPITNTWKVLADIPYPTRSCAAGAINNKIIVVGGYSNDNNVNENIPYSIQIYDIETNTWEVSKNLGGRISNMPEDIGNYLTGQTAISIKDGIIFIGGYKSSNQPSEKESVTTVAFYNITQNTWSQEKSIPHSSFGHGNIMVGNRIYVFEGASFEETLPGSYKSIPC